MSTALLRCSLGDIAILGGSLRLPTGRVWGGVVDVHSAKAPPDLSPASIVLTRESGREDVFAGVVRKSALNDGKEDLSVTVVGGKGLLASNIKARDHVKGATEVPAGLIAAGIVKDAGELLADGVERGLDALTVPHWHRVAGPASAALDLLVSLLGLAWRVLPSGRVWVGKPAFPAGPDLRRLGYQLEDGGIRYAPDGGQLLPGQTLEGRQISDVVYSLGGPLRAEVRGDVAGDPPHVPDVELYRRIWGARVETQDATSGLLDLVCDDARLGELRGVPIRCGIPGARILYQTPKGERVRVAFEAADPRLPYASAHDQVTTASRPFALVFDNIHVGTLEGVADPITGIVNFAYAQPNGLPQAGPIIELAGLITGPGHRDLMGKGVNG